MNVLFKLLFFCHQFTGLKGSILHLLDEADTDKDGKISLPEFQKLLRQVSMNSWNPEYKQAAKAEFSGSLLHMDAFLKDTLLSIANLREIIQKWSSRQKVIAVCCIFTVENWDLTRVKKSGNIANIKLQCLSYALGTTLLRSVIFINRMNSISL